MLEKATDLISILEKSLQGEPQKSFEEIGTVIKVGDGITKIYGLSNAAYGEIVNFEGGNRGMILDLDEDYVSAVLLDNSISVVEQEIAKRTGKVLQVPVGEELIGRVLSPIGEARDALGKISTKLKNQLRKLLLVL
mgnify:FL=1